LKPQREESAFHFERTNGMQTPGPVDPALRREAIAYYQSADALFGRGGEVATSQADEAVRHATAVTGFDGGERQTR
jgi:hypothetical protein